MKPLEDRIRRLWSATEPPPAPTLLLRPRCRLGALSDETLWEWARLSADVDMRHGAAPLATISDIHAGEEERCVALVLPGEDVLSFDLRLPPGSAAHGARAAPFLLEDYLLEDLDAVHIVLASPGPGDVRRVAAITADLLEATLARLAAAGLSPKAGWIDHDLLAAGREEVFCFADGERCVLCAPHVPGFAGPPGVAGWWAAEQGVSLDHPASELSGGGFFERLAWPAAGRASLNLLQGRFEPTVRRRERRLLAGAMMPLGLAMLVSLGLGAWHGRQADAIHREAREQFTIRRPELANVPSLTRALAMERAQPHGPARIEAPPIGALLGALGAALARLPADGRPRVTGLRFERARAYLEVLLEAGDIAPFEALRAAMDTGGTTARLVSASRRADRSQGTLRIGHVAR